MSHTPALTSAGRAARLREQLSGARSESRSARRLRQSPAANVLIGATLHAAARREQGLELTPLEERLTGELGALFGPDALAEFGRIYREPTSRAGITALFPALIADRPLEEGVGVEDLRAFAPTIEAEVADLPTVRKVSVEDLDREGVLTGGEEVVVVTAAPTEGTEFEIEAVHEARVRLVRFRCDRESNEEGKDEIYWASGAAGDNKAQIVVLTPVFEDVSTGTVRDFGPDAYWFKGAAQIFVGGNIQVWEQDFSDAAHYSKVRQVLADIARVFAESALSDGPGFDTILLGLVAAAAALVNWILGLNKDDFIAEKSIAFTRDALVRMAATNGGRSDLVFDGGIQGKFTLTLEVTFGPVIADGLNHSIFYNGSWSTPVHIPHLVSATRANMAVHNGKLYAAYVDSSGLIQLTDYNGEHWSRPRHARFPIGTPRAAARVGATLVTFQGHLHVFWKDVNDHQGTLAYISPEGLLEQRRTGMLVYEPPSFVVHSDTLLMFVNNNGMPGVRIFWFDTSDNTWESLTSHTNADTILPPAVVRFKDRLWLYYTNRANPPRVQAKTTSATGGIFFMQWADAPNHGMASSLAPSATIAALGAYDAPEEMMFCSGYSTGDSFLSTSAFREQGHALYTGTRVNDLRNNVSIAAHQGTLHMLYW